MRRDAGDAEPVQQQLPHLTAHDVGEVDAEVRAVLTEIGSER